MRLRHGRGWRATEPTNSRKRRRCPGGATCSRNLISSSSGSCSRPRFVSGILGDWLEAGAIFAIVVLNALLGFFQERKAEEALSSLRKLSSPDAKVLRDGSLHNIAAEELVRGDVVELEAGDRVPADLRLIRTFGLKTQEAALTGESTPVEKEAEVGFA